MPTILATMLIFADPGPPRVQWVVYGSSFCRACIEAENDFKPWLTKSGWRVGHEATDQIRLIDINCETEAAADAKIQVVPTYTLLADGKEVRRFISYPGREYMAREFLRQHERLK